MYFKKRQSIQPGIELRTQDGRRVPLHITFLNGEIHLNASDMEKGAYELVMDRGAIVESKSIRVR
ncbi:MAG: hypothetical protein KDC53_06635 [Saprospiraceae bacterium]|nr:hypothetical protein [Saprospiraceae bacterium]